MATSQNNRFFQIIQISTPILVAFFGLYNSYSANQTQAKIKVLENELAKTQAFTEYIQNTPQIIADKDPTVASVTLAGLYALADSEKEKRIIVTMAALTEQDKVIKFLDALTKNDQDVARIMGSDEIISLLSYESDRSNAGRPLPPSNPTPSELPAEIAQTTDTPPPDNSKTQLLETITTQRPELEPERESDGWAYLGKVQTNSAKLGDDRTIDVTEIPSNNDTITMMVNTHLRDRQPRGSLGDIIGVIPEGQAIVILDIHRAPFASGREEAIWAKVKLNH
jgi:hypothetical protein